MPFFGAKEPPLVAPDEVPPPNPKMLSILKELRVRLISLDEETGEVRGELLLLVLLLLLL
jgi:hypothetical protein